MAWATSRIPRFVMGLAALAVLFAIASAAGANDRSRMRHLTMEQAVATAELTGAPILAVGGEST